MLHNYEGRWLAVQVRSKAEYLVEACLQHKGYEVYLPTYQREKRTAGSQKPRLPLFAGYLFCRFSSAAQAPIVTTSGVVRILGVGGIPLPVDEREITSLRAIEAVPSVRSFPWPQLEVGDEICICEGPLRGLRGILLMAKGENTLVVSVPLLRRSVAVEVRADWILPHSAAARVADGYSLIDCDRR